jgi:hypothetical protein
LQIAEKCQFDGPGTASYHQALAFKGLKLGEIAQELSTAYGPDAYTPPRRCIGFIKSSSGEPIFGRNMLVDDHLSMTLMPGFYHFFENIHYLQFG